MITAVLYLLFTRKIFKDCKLKTIIKVFFVTIIVSILFFAFIGEDQRWFIINGSSAESYAIDLLNGNSNVETPDHFIDYVVTARDGYVIFSQHTEHDVFYGYFPDKPPSEISGIISSTAWAPMGGDWFVSRL